MPMTFFPQINSNLVMTQLPYSSKVSFETIVADVESGPRFAFGRRGFDVPGFPTTPLLDGAMLNYTMVSDDEAATLETFFNNVRGRWGRFSFLDPGGNALLYSEDFSQSYWEKSGTSIADKNRPDPFGHPRATLFNGGGDAHLAGVIGPSDGGLSGFVVNASVWVNRTDDHVPIFIGVINSTAEIRGRTWNIAANTWTRIDATVQLWDNNYFRFILGGSGTWTGGAQIFVYGAQVVPTKGRGGYYKSPELYGYHPVCRFDVDGFNLAQDGPNQNKIQLPIKELQIL